MTTILNPCFSEALTSFVAAKKEGKKALEGYQELSRFIAWCGKERRVIELSPSEVADYAQSVGISGSEPSQRLTPVKEFLGFLKDEGWIQTGLASHLRVPRTRRASGGRKGAVQSAANEASYMSKEGYQRLVVQLEGLKEERVSVVEDIKRAMSDKDFRENAPLDAAKERQGIIESRIRDLEAGLADTQILTKDTSAAARQKAKVGSKVSLKDLASGKNVTYTLVDAREADASSGRISTVSPVGQALLERAAGDEVTINVPKGTLRYTVQKIER